ncbi:MAG: glycosyltransferase family 4 protein [Acidobacteriota bacterium]
MNALRVVILTTYFRPIVGGVESTAERLARYLQAEGCAVRVVTKRVTSDLPDVEGMDGFVVQRIGPGGQRSGAGKWRIVPAAFTWLVLHAVSYDVVCCIDYRGIGIAALLAKAITGRPVVLQAQTTGVLSAANAVALLGRWHVAPGGAIARLVTWPFRRVYRSADAYACISHEIGQEASRVGIEAQRIHYLPNAVDMRNFRPPTVDERRAKRAELAIPPGVVVCLFVGRLSREKGPMDLMDAWRLLATDKAILLVAGPDMGGHAWDEGPSARAYVQQHNLSASVRFLGSIADVASLLRVADLVVQPSHFEALGLSAIEALATGIPVVASAVGGLLDFIVDNDNGILHLPHKPSALAACLRALIDDPALRQRLAARARPSVIDVYDERVVFSRFAGLLRLLTGADA